MRMMRNASVWFSLTNSVAFSHEVSETELKKQFVHLHFDGKQPIEVHHVESVHWPASPARSANDIISSLQVHTPMPPIKVTLVKEIGKGAHGEVYDVTIDSDFRRRNGQAVTQAVLKKINLRTASSIYEGKTKDTIYFDDNINPKALRRVQNEFLAGQHFTIDAPHANIVETYGLSVDENNKYAYLLIQKIVGQDLHTLYRYYDENPKPIDELDKKTHSRTDNACYFTHAPTWIHVWRLEIGEYYVQPGHENDHVD